MRDASGLPSRCGAVGLLLKLLVEGAVVEQARQRVAVGLLQRGGQQALRLIEQRLPLRLQPLLLGHVPADADDVLWAPVGVPDERLGGAGDQRPPVLADVAQLGLDLGRLSVEEPAHRLAIGGQVRRVQQGRPAPGRPAPTRCSPAARRRPG